MRFHVELPLTLPLGFIFKADSQIQTQQELSKYSYQHIDSILYVLLNCFQLELWQQPTIHSIQNIYYYQVLLLSTNRNIQFLSVSFVSSVNFSFPRGILFFPTTNPGYPRRLDKTAFDIFRVEGLGFNVQPRQLVYRGENCSTGNSPRRSSRKSNEILITGFNGTNVFPSFSLLSFRSIHVQNENQL